MTPLCVKLGKDFHDLGKTDKQVIRETGLGFALPRTRSVFILFCLIVGLFVCLFLYFFIYLSIFVFIRVL